jgi:hypothetical protein
VKKPGLLLQVSGKGQQGSGNFLGMIEVVSISCSKIEKQF